MTKLIIMRGVSGSGKSTAARSAQKGTNSVVVSRDDLRIALFGVPFTVPDGTKVDENLISEVEYHTITKSLLAGYDVISDNTNLYPNGIIERVNLAFMAGAEVDFIEIYCSLSKCLSNNTQRSDAGGRYVPEEVIVRQYRAFDTHREEVFEIFKRLCTGDLV